jgi:hypothetical protein
LSQGILVFWRDADHAVENAKRDDGDRAARNFDIFEVGESECVTDDASPLGPEELRKIVADISRDPEANDQLKQLSGAEALPPR